MKLIHRTYTSLYKIVYWQSVIVYKYYLSTMRGIVRIVYRLKINLKPFHFGSIILFVLYMGLSTQIHVNKHLNDLKTNAQVNNFNMLFALMMLLWVFYVNIWGEWTMPQAHFIQNKCPLLTNQKRGIFAYWDEITSWWSPPPPPPPPTNH